MRKKNYKGRCEKRTLSKCKGICKTYDDIQSAYADVLEKSEDIREFKGNVELEGMEYTTDFLCTTIDDDYIVRECVFKKYLSKPMTVKLLDTSREYWLRRGVTDWGLVINEE